PRSVGIRPADVWGCSRKPSSSNSDITFRIVAELQPGARANLAETACDPTGSPVTRYSSMIVESTAWRRESALGRGPLVFGIDSAIFQSRSVGTLVSITN